MSNEDAFLEHGPEFDGYESPRKAADGWDLVGWILFTVGLILTGFTIFTGSPILAVMALFSSLLLKVLSTTIVIFLRWMSAIYNSLSAVDPGIYPAKRKE